jgi:O-antigen/teichoic acid export membrane protein
MPTRSKRFLASLISGYGTIAANIIYTMTSIPLALHYLSKEEFGLWALAMQVNGYLGLLDFGMSSAVSRFLADHKDDVNGGEYGSLLQTGGIVFLIQGIAVALVGFSFSWFAPAVFAVPSHLGHSLTWSLTALAAVSGISICARSIGSPLWAFQRMEVINICSSVGLLLNLPLMWIGFELGLGIYSLAVANVPTLILTFFTFYRVCSKNGFYPKRGCWGAPRWNIFRHIFIFGSDVLLITLGSQLINATQIMIVSRMLGLDAAATFSVATKLYTMGQQLFHKVIESAAPGLTELYVRGENSRFVQRYWDALGLALALATLAAVGMAAFNSQFVHIWTKGAIVWPPFGDVLLAVMLVLTSLTRNLVGIFGIIKSFRKVRFIYLAEGFAFIPIAIYSTKTFGVVGIIAASIIAHLLVTIPCSFKAAGKVLGNMRPALANLGLSACLIALGGIVGWTSGKYALPLSIQITATIICVLVSAALVWFLSLTQPVRGHLTTYFVHAARPLARILGFSL